MHDQLNDGRSYRIHNVIDDYNRESDILIDFSLLAERILQGLDQLIEWRGKPKQIRSDNGPEYISDLMSVWCMQHGITHVFTQPSNPQQNAYVERFNRTVLYECLNQNLFRDLSELQDYTTQRYGCTFIIMNDLIHQLMVVHLILNNNKGIGFSTH